MSIPILNLPPKRKSPGQLLAEGLGVSLTGAAQGLDQSLQNFRNEKAGTELGKFLGLEGENLQTFARLKPDDRKLALTIGAQQAKTQQAQQQQIGKTKEAIPKVVTTTLKGLGVNPDDVGSKKLLDLNEDAEKAFEETGDPLAAQQVVRQFVQEQIADQQEEVLKKENTFFERLKDASRGKPISQNPLFKPFFTPEGQSFISGLARKSAAGAIAGQFPDADQLAKEALENPSFSQEVAEDFGVLAADIPFMAIGSRIGGAAGAFALPAFLRSFANKIWNGLRSDEKLTIQKLGTDALDVATDTVKAALTGEAFKLIPGLKSAVKRIPGAEKALNNFMVDKIFDIAGTTGVIAGTEAAIEGRVPTPRDFTKALALTLGFEAAQLPAGIRRNIETKAEKTNLEPKQFAEKVQERAKEQNIDLAKVEAGKGPELQKFNRVVNEISRENLPPEAKKAERVVEKAEKPEIAREKLIERGKEERKLVTKAAKSPLDVYFEPPKLPVREETIAKRTAIESDLTRRETLAKANLKKENSKVLGLESDLRQSPPAEKPKIEDALDNAREARQKQRDILDDIGFKKSELKKGRVVKERPVPEDIAKQIETSFEKLQKEIQDPESVDTKKAKAQAKRDKEAIDLANKILKRGELLSQPEVDTFIRVRDQYLKANQEMIKTNNKIIENLKDSTDPAQRKISQEAKAMNERLEKRIRREKADIVKQRDKKAVQKLTRGARGAFFKSKLKNLREDVGAFQKDFFKQVDLKSKSQAQVEVTAKKAIEEVRKVTESFVKNPTGLGAEKNLKEISEKTGASEESLKDTVFKLRGAIEKAANKAKAGKSVEAEIKGVNKTTNNFIKEQFNKKNIKKALLGGAIIAVVQNLVEKTTGWKPPATLISLLAPGGLIGKVGGAVIARIINQIAIGGMNHIEAKKFKAVKDRKNSIAIQHHRKELRKRVSASRANKIEKKANTL